MKDTKNVTQYIEIFTHKALKSVHAYHTVNIRRMCHMIVIIAVMYKLE